MFTPPNDMMLYSVAEQIATMTLNRPEKLNAFTNDMLRCWAACLEQAAADKELYARASRVLHKEANPGNALPLIQRHGDKELWLTAPPFR